MRTSSIRFLDYRTVSYYYCNTAHQRQQRIDSNMPVLPRDQKMDVTCRSNCTVCIRVSMYRIFNRAANRSDSRVIFFSLESTTRLQRGLSGTGQTRSYLCSANFLTRGLPSWNSAINRTVFSAKP